MRLIQRLITFCSVASLLAVTTSAVAQDDMETRAAISRFQQAEQTQPFFANAYGYAVFPSVGKGGFWIGGAYGEGTVYQGGTITGYTKLYQVSIGLQFGGQAYSEIIFFQDKRAYDRFTSGSFEVDAQASAVALTEGASARAGTAGASASTGDTLARAAYINGMAIFTFAKGGMMIEASIAGQKFDFEPLRAVPEA